MEDKKFFVKDFIQYCSPCFACDGLMTFRLGVRERHPTVAVPDDDRPNSYSTVVTDKYVESELNIRYHSSLKIWIYHRNNKVVASNSTTFSNFLAEKRLFLYCVCSVCRSDIASKPLDFQTFNGVVGPATLHFERYNISVKNRRYSLETDFVKGTSIGRVRTYIAPNVSKADLVFNMKLLPKYKIGSRQKLIDKLNTYAIFS